jgi:hypothetical protein
VIENLSIKKHKRAKKRRNCSSVTSTLFPSLRPKMKTTPSPEKLCLM